MKLEFSIKLYDLLRKDNTVDILIHEPGKRRSSLGIWDYITSTTAFYQSSKADIQIVYDEAGEEYGEFLYKYRRYLTDQEFLLKEQGIPAGPELLIGVLMKNEFLYNLSDIKRTYTRDGGFRSRHYLLSEERQAAHEIAGFHSYERKVSVARAG